MGNVLVRLLFRRAFLIVVGIGGRGHLGRGRRNGFLDGGYDRIGLSGLRRGLVSVLIMGMFVIMMMVLVTVMMIVIVAMIIMMLVLMTMRLVLVMLAMRFVSMRIELAMLAMRHVTFERLCLGGCIRRGALDDLAADAVAMAAAAGIAVA